MSDLEELIREVRPDEGPARAIVRAHRRQVLRHVPGDRVDGVSSLVFDGGLEALPWRGLSRSRGLTPWLLAAALLVVAGLAGMVLRGAADQEPETVAAEGATVESPRVTTGSVPKSAVDAPVIWGSGLEPEIDGGRYSDDVISVEWVSGDIDGQLDVWPLVADSFEQFVSSRTGPQPDTAVGRVLDERAVLDFWDGGATAIWEYAGFVYEINGSFPDRQSLEDLLERLAVVEGATWLGFSPVARVPHEDRNRQFYVVQEGDTLSGVAAAFDVTVDVLRTLNSLTSDAIEPGQQLVIASDPPGDLDAPATTAIPEDHR
ncbi:MAG: LysM peptidoglycan-binding domain-containing protein [Acidimicrobiales bacterium]